MNPEEMRSNAIELVKHVAREAPENIGIVVMFYDKSTRSVVLAGNDEERVVRDMIDIALRKPVKDGLIIKG